MRFFTRLVCAALFLLPALALMQGLPAGPPPTVAAILGAPLKENDRRADHLRATSFLIAEVKLIKLDLDKYGSKEGRERLLTRWENEVFKAPK